MGTLSDKGAQFASLENKWGSVAVATELFSFLLSHSVGSMIDLSAHSAPQPVAVFFFLFAWGLGFLGGAMTVAGLFRDRRKALSLIGLLLFPFCVVFTV